MPGTTDITYGGPSHPNETCGRCGKLIRDHNLGGKDKIKPTQSTTDLAKRILNKLDDAYNQYLARLKKIIVLKERGLGHESSLSVEQIEERAAKESTMIGVAIATFKNPKNNKNEKKKFGTASGILGAQLLLSIPRTGDFSSMQFITEPNVVDISREEKKFFEINTAGNKIEHIKITPTVRIHRNNAFKNDVLPSKDHKFTIYGNSEQKTLALFNQQKEQRIPLPSVELGSKPVGSCAAQKLFDAIFAYAWEKGMLVTKIDMSEVFWHKSSNSQGNFQYQRGALVPSCDTCQTILPQMLCNLVGK